MLAYIIDDDPISLYLTEQVLEMEEFAQRVRIFDAADAALAHLLAHLGAELPDVVFLDLNMPVVSGWQFLDALAPYEAALLGRCRIYLLTSSLAQADTARARDYALVTGIIHKPLDEEEVRAIRAQIRQEAIG